MARRAGIIGAGIAGLSAAIALRQAGYEISIFEQAPALEPAGAALSLWENAILALRELGAAGRIECEAAPINSVSVRDRRGGTIMKELATRRDSAGRVLAFLPTRTLLQRALLDVLGPDAVKHNCTIEAVTQNGREAIVLEKNGAESSFDLVAAADGIWSATARGTRRPVLNAGYGGVLALTEPLTNTDGLAARGDLCEYWAPGERIGIGNIGHDRRYWYCLLNEPEPHACRSMSLARIIEHFRDWPDEIGRVLAATHVDRLIPFTVHDAAAPRTLGDGRIILTGDAAHAMQPNLGQGGCQAIEDALALREAAKVYAPEHVLAAYTRMRLSRVRLIVRSSTHVGRLVHGLPTPVSRFMQGVTALMPAAVNAAQFNRVRRLPDYRAQAVRPL